MMPVSLELGGKSPTMVLADADLDHAVAGVLYGIFSSSGESCIAGSRLFVASERYDEFMERLATGAAALRVGDPADERTQMGLLISARHRESVERYVEMGVAEGGRLRTGAYVPMAQPSIVATSTPRPLSRGSPMAPACAGKRSSARCWWPCLHQRRGPDRGGQRQLLRAGRRHLDPRLPARLAARPRRAGRHRVDQHLQAVLHLHPFGGWRDSGLGREKGRLGILQYMEQKSLYWGLNEQPLAWAGSH